MAKKQRASHLDQPSTLPPKHQHQHADDATSSPPSSSSQTESQEEEETDDEQTQPTLSSQPPSKTTQHAKPNPKSSSSSEEQGSETESDSDSEPQPTPKLKSINSKPIDQTSKSNPKTKSSPPPARSGTKRSADENINRSKKKKTDSSEKEVKEVEEDKKKSVAFQRVFNDDDEVAILQGVIDFTASTGDCPFKHHAAFYEFVKKSIHVEITLEQLRDKIRRMKVKFLDKTKNGKVPTFSKPVEQKIFDLGQKIWGYLVKNKGEVEEKPKANGKRSVKDSAKKQAATKKLVMESDSPLVVSKETTKVEKVESGDGKENPCESLFWDKLICFNKSVGISGMNDGVMKKELELIEESKRRELERKWKKLHIAETELFVKKAELVQTSASLILKALQSSSSSN